MLPSRLLRAQNAINAIIFLGTPHRAGDISTEIETLMPGIQYDAVESLNREIQTINVAFEARDNPSPQVISFYETGEFLSHKGVRPAAIKNGLTPLSPCSHRP